MVDLVCLGEPMLEFSQTQNNGQTVFVQGYGGDTSNCAIAAARQGASVGHLTALGDDAFGRAITDLWQREGVDASRVQIDPDRPTGIYFISYEGNEHTFSYMRKGSAASCMRAADLPLDYIRGAKMLHVSGISQAIGDSACDCVFAAITAAREAGVKVSFDTNLRLQLWPLERARAMIHGGLKLCDVALPGMDDSLQLTGLSDPDALVDFYLDLGPKVVALKMGAKGVLVATPEGRTRVAPLSVTQVDASGAGDTFDGSFLAELIAGRDPVAAARYANVAAALSTQSRGAVASIPTRAQVTQALNASA